MNIYQHDFFSLMVGLVGAASKLAGNTFPASKKPGLFHRVCLLTGSVSLLKNRLLNTFNFVYQAVPIFIMLTIINLKQ